MCGSDHSAALHVHEVPAAASCVAGIEEEEERREGANEGCAAGAAGAVGAAGAAEEMRLMTRVMMWGLCTKTRDWQLGVAAQPVAVQLQDPDLGAAGALQAGSVGKSALASQSALPSPRLSSAARFVTLAAGAQEWGKGRGESVRGTGKGGEKEGEQGGEGGGQRSWSAPRAGPPRIAVVAAELR